MAIFSRLTKRTGTFFDPLIGLTYTFNPYFTALTLQFMQTENNTIVDQLMRIMFVVVFVLAIVNSYLINYYAASITVRNKHLVKNLYPFFTSKHSMNSVLKNLGKLKINGFIAQLNKQYIGYRCYNLFKFTKLAFYQYYLTLSSTYMLIYKIMNIE